MTSFISKTFSFTGHHLPETVCAVLATSRTLMNSSIVPVTLSDDETWDILSTFANHQTTSLLDIFVNYCDTMQFSQKLRISNGATSTTPSSSSASSESPTSFMTTTLKVLIDKTRYFCRTLQHLDLVCESIPIVCGKLTNIQSMSLEHCDPTAFGDAELELICKHLTLLKSLNLHGKKQVTDAGLKHIGHLRLLEDLDLRRVINMTALPFLKQTIKLQRLRVGQCPALPHTAFDNCDINDVLPALTELDINSCKKFTIHTFDKIQLLAPNLTTLCCTHVPEEAFIDSISAMQHLQKIDLVDLLQQGKSLTSTAMECMSKNLKFLTYLELVVVSSNRSFSNSHLQAISQSVAPLRSLKLTVLAFDGPAFDDEGFSSLCSLTHLEELELNIRADGFTGDLLVDSGKRFSPTLRKVTLLHCPHLCDNGLVSILKGLKNLEQLHVRSCDLVTSQGLLDALEGTLVDSPPPSSSPSSLNHQSSSSSLTELDLSGSGGFKDLRFLSVLVSLTKLVLNSTSNLDFPSMRENRTGFDCLPDSAPLQELNIGFNSGIEDQDVSAILLRVKNDLKRFRLKECEKITSKCLTETIAFSIPNLSLLNIRNPGNDAFTLADVMFVVDNLKYLKKCVVSNSLMAELIQDKRLKRKYEHILTMYDDE